MQWSAKDLAYQLSGLISLLFTFQSLSKRRAGMVRKNNKGSFYRISQSTSSQFACGLRVNRANWPSLSWPQKRLRPHFPVTAAHGLDFFLLLKDKLLQSLKAKAVLEQTRFSKPKKNDSDNGEFFLEVTPAGKWP